MRKYGRYLWKRKNELDFNVEKIEFDEDLELNTKLVKSFNEGVKELEKTGDFTLLSDFLVKELYDKYLQIKNNYSKINEANKKEINKTTLESFKSLGDKITKEMRKRKELSSKKDDFISVFESFVNETEHIVKKIGEYEIKDLSPIILQKFVTELLKNGNLKTGKELSPNTVNAIISVVQNSLKTAFTIEISDTYFADKIKRPNVTEKVIECFSLSEQKSIENAVLHAKKPKLIGIVICLYTGLRIGELLALEWSDIDLSKGIIQYQNLVISDTIKMVNMNGLLIHRKQAIPHG